MAIEALHHIGLLSFLIVLGGLVYIVRKWGKHHHLSLSNHAALQKPSYRIFAGSLALGGVLFYVFALGWLMPTLQLGWPYGVLLTVAIACELVAAFIPDGKHGKGKVHRLTAWTMAVCMLLLTVSLLFAPVGGVVAKYIVAILASYMFFEWILFVFVKWSRRFFLIFQSAYVLSFYLAVLVMTYVG